MNIKTITCHDVYNYGASLQAYALMKYLQKQGHYVEIIDYKPDYLRFSFWNIGSRWNKNIFLKGLYYAYVVPKRLLQYKMRDKFDTFTRDYLNLTSETYQSNEELKANTPKADLFIAGSDQIWNTEHMNGRDPAFYLNFVSLGAVKSSYAASFSVDYIKSDYISLVKKELSSFDFISVREKTGLSILDKLQLKGTLVLDPVYLLSKDKWLELALDNNRIKEKYILIYDQERNEAIKETALFLARKYNLKIVAIQNLYPMKYADYKVKYAGPREFLGLVKNCSYMLTNSFHGMSFSLIFNKQFYIFPREHQKVNSRMVDLLTILGIEHQILHRKIEKEEVIDYTLVNSSLDELRKKSKSFLRTITSKL